MCLNDRNRMGSWKQLSNVLSWIPWFYDVKILIEIYSSLTCNRSAQSRPYADQPLKNIGYTSCSLFVIYLVLEDERFIFLILHISLIKTTTNSSVEHTLSACCLWESYSFSPWSFCVWIGAIDLSLGLPSNDFTVPKKKKKNQRWMDPWAKRRLQRSRVFLWAWKNSHKAAKWFAQSQVGSQYPDRKQNPELSDAHAVFAVHSKWI